MSANYCKLYVTEKFYSIRSLDNKNEREREREREREIFLLDLNFVFVLPVYCSPHILHSIK